MRITIILMGCDLLNGTKRELLQEVWQAAICKKYLLKFVFDFENNTFMLSFIIIYFMKTFFLPLLLSPLLALAQSSRTTDAANPVQIKSYSTSAGTFTIERGSATAGAAVPDEIDFIETITKTSDGGTSTLVLNKEAYEESFVNLIVENEIQVTISPNPFNTTANFIINTDEDVHKAVFEIYDVFGRMVKSTSIQTLTFSFEKNNLSDGFYFYRIKLLTENREEKTIGGKFIINSNQETP